MTLLIDTHAHLNLASFDKDYQEVIEKNLRNDVWIINVGTNYLSSQKAVEIAERYNKGVYAAIGLHPINLDTGLLKMRPDKLEGIHFEKEFNYQEYRELAQSEKVIAIGEIGLDFYFKPKTTGRKKLFKDKQKHILSEQLSLAKELGLAVIFHCRMAHQDLVEFLLENPDIRPKKAVAHSFVGTIEELEKYLSLGFYIGFNGIIFKTIKGVDFEEIIKKTPLSRILLETDCPYLPPPQRAGERNEPSFSIYTARHIAKIRNMDCERLIEQSTKNAKVLFGI